MIPKKIHYCWFGKNPLPRSAKKCIASWKKYLPDYEIKEWNEDNFDVSMSLYTHDAYEAKKYAFVSDVARLFALVKEGGIYMDTDVEVVRSLDPLLCHHAFMGFEGVNYIATNIIGSEAAHPFFSYLLSSYGSRRFIKDNGNLDLSTNVVKITSILEKEYQLILSGEEQVINGIYFYPTDFFSPYDYITGRLHLTQNTFTIHWFDQSWTKRIAWKVRLSQLYHRIIGQKME